MGTQEPLASKGITYNITYKGFLDFGIPGVSVMFPLTEVWTHSLLITYITNYTYSP